MLFHRLGQNCCCKVSEKKTKTPLFHLFCVIFAPKINTKKDFQ